MNNLGCGGGPDTISDFDFTNVPGKNVTLDLRNTVLMALGKKRKRRDARYGLNSYKNKACNRFLVYENGVFWTPPLLIWMSPNLISAISPVRNEPL